MWQPLEKARLGAWEKKGKMWGWTFEQMLIRGFTVVRVARVGGTDNKNIKNSD